MSHHKNLVAEAVHKYAVAINEGQIEKIISFYSEEGKFMPGGIKTLKKNQIGNKRFPLMKEKEFKIQYSEVKIKIEDNFAFVETIAETSESDLERSSKLEKTSRDFFIFRKECNDWKIFRYIFNHFRE